MPEKFLYEKVLEEFGRRTIQDTEIPTYLTDNLNPTFELRRYQEEAFTHFFLCFENEFDGKENTSHFLFNMATGSGKTLIMAGLILYLYQNGYRNFLFFVNATNIIEKTKDNFLNPLSSKYLFNERIHLNGKPVEITPVENFEAVNEQSINMCFTTIQKLHSDLTVQKENALTFEDFAEKRIVLLADEAHHMNVQTKTQPAPGQKPKPSWENTVEEIFDANTDNLLLEFTATHDYDTAAMKQKYLNKVIYRYDLINFRNDRFSKEVILVNSNLDLQARILQALILNQYKQEVASKNGINLKPVILFKAQKTIAQSQENQENFHRLIDELTGSHINHIRLSNHEIVQRAFRFFDQNNLGTDQLAQRLKSEFRNEYCLSVNNEKEKETYQLLVNTLEDTDNPIRAIFAVQKLNEGWDVLNLFDIVRCYETRDSGGNKIGKTTTAEAQLIGRGARYFPFVLPNHPDKFRRKFDSDIHHELRILEELHYHSIRDSRYISEIRKALIDTGMIDTRTVTRPLKLKNQFKQTQFYKSGVVWLNKRIPKNYQNVKSLGDFANLSVKRKNYVHLVHTATGSVAAPMKDPPTGGVTALMTDPENSTPPTPQASDSRDLKVTDIEQNIVQAALARNPFFTFESLKRYFPHITSIREFITSDNYLGGLAITFTGDLATLQENRSAKLEACQGLLAQIETEIRKEITEYQGTTLFHETPIRTVFTDKTLKLNADSSPADNTEVPYWAEGRDWFAFETLYGTSEEKAFVHMLDRWIHEAKENYDEIYLLRNENHFAIYNFADGRPFQPDFVLFLHQKNGTSISYQLFIEPKGEHIEANDRWKAEFLEQIQAEGRSCQILTEDSKYRIIGVPTFYQEKYENRFKHELNTALKKASQPR